MFKASCFTATRIYVGTLLVDVMSCHVTSCRLAGT